MFKIAIIRHPQNANVDQDKKTFEMSRVDVELNVGVDSAIVSVIIDTIRASIEDNIYFEGPGYQVTLATSTAPAVVCLR